MAAETAAGQGDADDGPAPELDLGGPDGPDDADARVLVASLDDRWVGVAAADVQAVVRPARVTPVGGTPRWVVGVAAVRGAVLPVVDAGRLAGAHDAQDAGGAWWVVVAGGGQALAVAGLRVWRVARLAPGEDDEDAAPAPPGLPAGGVARLAVDTGRGADALPPAVRLLDARALLDLVHDPTAEP